MKITGSRKTVHNLYDHVTERAIPDANTYASLAIAYALLDVADAIRAGKDQT